MPSSRSLIAATAFAITLSFGSVGHPLAADGTSETTVGAIRITGPWARASAGMATVGAAYMTLANTGDAADRLVEASSPVATKTELHTHIVEGDIMRMREIDSIDLPPGETVELQPGGHHVMLIGLNAPLQMGETFPLTLTFAEAGTTTVDVAVLEPGALEPGRDHADDDAPQHGHGHGAHGQVQAPAAAGMKPAQQE
jgi:periplasmic copper chaperone A